MGSDGFMLHDMLYWHTALLSHPGSSLIYTAHFNPIYTKLTALYNSPFSFCTSSLSLFFFCLCLCVFSLPLSPCVYSSSHFVPRLSLCSWLRRCLPCTPWWYGSCLNRTTMVLTCVPSPSCSTMLERDCALSSVLLIKRSVSVFYM